MTIPHYRKQRTPIDTTASVLESRTGLNTKCTKGGKLHAHKPHKHKPQDGHMRPKTVKTDTKKSGSKRESVNTTQLLSYSWLSFLLVDTKLCEHSTQCTKYSRAFPRVCFQWSLEDTHWNGFPQGRSDAEPQLLFSSSAPLACLQPTFPWDLFESSPTLTKGVEGAWWSTTDCLPDLTHRYRRLFCFVCFMLALLF